MCLGLRISSYLVHSVVCTPQSLGKLKKTRGEATAFLLLPPPGTADLTHPSRPGLPGQPREAEGLGTARVTKALEMKERRSARCPRVAALVQRQPPKPPPRPAGGSHCLLPWVSPITWGGLAGDSDVTGATGRANCVC
jgi:hypothetical protein